MPYITHNKQRIFYTYNKTKVDAPAMVLIHGAGGSHNNWPQVWRQAASTLSEARLDDFPVYALDLPGHNYSDPPGRSSIDDYVQDVLAFIDALALKQVIIVGHSMGGAIAQAIGVRRLPQLAGLVLIGTGARLAVNETILNGLQTDFAETVQLIMKFGWPKEAPPASKQQATKRMLDTPPGVVYDDFVACDTSDLSDQLNQIQVPTLVVGGSDDKLTPLKASRFLVDHIPNAQLAVIEGAGHYMMIEKPAEVTEALLAFLRKNL